MLNDLRFGLRMLQKNPGFTLIVVSTLGLCLGANITIFATLDAILLRSLPLREPERLVTMFNEYRKMGMGRLQSSIPNLYTRRGNLDGFSSVAAYKQDAVVVGEAGHGRRVQVLRVSREFFQTVGVDPVLGRAFLEEEMVFQTHHVVILSDRYWRERLRADPGVVGQSIRINGFDKTIVGVLPPGFRFLSSRAEVFLPLSSSLDQRGIDNLHNSSDCEMIGRLRPGVRLEVAQAQVDAHNNMVARDFPFAKEVEAAGFRTRVMPLQASHVESIRSTLLTLQAGGLCLLLIGGVNLINLLLVRATARTREQAVRLALGASRARVVRQSMTEVVLLTILGGLFGWMVGGVGIRLLGVLGVDRLPMGLEVVLSDRVTGLALLVSVAVGIAIGGPVAWFQLRGHLLSALHSETRGSTANHAVQRLQHGFVAAQIALTFVLLTGVGFLAVSLKRTMEISPGFRPDHILTGHISMRHRNYLEDSARLRFAERIVAAIESQPGIQAAGIANNVPVGGKESGNQRRVLTASGGAAISTGSPIAPNIYGVAGDYFSALRIPVLAGRVFDGSESRRQERVCIVDETYAQRNWPNMSPVDQVVYNGAVGPPGDSAFTVIGVVGSVKQTELTEPPGDGTVYFPLRDCPLSADDLFLVMRSSQRPETISALAQKVVLSVEPELPLHDLRTMEIRIADSLIMRRAPLLLASAFAAVALLLAGLGTYGVLSFAVAQRRREIGVRMALGALPGQIARQFLSLGLRQLCVGAGVGTLGAWMAARAMRGVLFRVSSPPLTVFVVTALILGAVSVLACLVPALRASRIDPMDALRDE